MPPINFSFLYIHVHVHIQGGYCLEYILWADLTMTIKLSKFIYLCAVYSCACIIVSLTHVLIDISAYDHHNHAVCYAILCGDANDSFSSL